MQAIFFICYQGEGLDARAMFGTDQAICGARVEGTISIVKYNPRESRALQ